MPGGAADEDDERGAPGASKMSESSQILVTVNRVVDIIFQNKGAALFNGRIDSTLSGTG